MAKVDLVGVTKRWGDFVAVDNQSLSVADKEFLALLGPSGCGKTTALRMIAGLEDATEGKILIGDRDVTYELPKDRDVAMVFQNYGLYPHMTVADNIAYPLKVRNVGKTAAKDKVAQAANKTRISELLARKPRELSGGQRQRVALARAIVREPQAFLMDEPLSNLDAQLRLSMRAELQHLSRELSVTTIYVTHDQIEAMTLADRVAVMKSGVIQQLAPPEEIHNYPANLFVAGFIGSPPMNLIPGAIEGGDFVCDGIRVPKVGSGDRKNVVFGARPEDVEIVPPSEGHLDTEVYAFERTGDRVLITVELHNRHFTACGDRELKVRIGENISLRTNVARTRMFDGDSGELIRDLLPAAKA